MRTQTVYHFINKETNKEVCSALNNDDEMMNIVEKYYGVKRSNVVVKQEEIEIYDGGDLKSETADRTAIRD